MKLFGQAEAKSYEIAGKVLHCQHCGNDAFHRREAQLNTAVASLFNLDWANASAACFVCDRCGHIHWFLPS